MKKISNAIVGITAIMLSGMQIPEAAAKITDKINQVKHMAQKTAGEMQRKLVNNKYASLYEKQDVDDLHIKIGKMQSKLEKKQALLAQLKLDVNNISNHLNAATAVYNVAMAKENLQNDKDIQEAQKRVAEKAKREAQEKEEKAVNNELSKIKASRSPALSRKNSSSSIGANG